jgi:hypothetical protein
MGSSAGGLRPFLAIAPGKQASGRSEVTDRPDCQPRPNDRSEVPAPVPLGPGLPVPGPAERLPVLVSEPAERLLGPVRALEPVAMARAAELASAAEQTLELQPLAARP